MLYPLSYTGNTDIISLYYMDNFWKKLPKPFFALAPMEDVTDTVFRQIVARCARPDVFFTEFTSVDGLVSAGKALAIDHLRYSESERPIVAQIWGNNPEHCFAAAREVQALGFDGIDINMGCPVKKIVKRGACAALIKQPKLAQILIRAVQEGAGDLPVSVKTRIGFDHIQTKEWLQVLLETNPAAITIHARTAKELSNVPPHWDEIALAVAMRNDMGADTLIIGNGDVQDRESGLGKYRKYHPDGIMIGRGIFHNLWAFDTRRIPQEAAFKKLLVLLGDHIRLFEETWGTAGRYNTLKRFFKVYVRDTHGASRLRVRLMATKSAADARHLLEDALVDL